MKSFLVICNQSPFVDVSLKESLDMALIFAAIDQEVSLLLQGNALFGLLAGQSIDTLCLKNYLKAFGTLALYDIDQIYVCAQSLEELNLKESQFAFDVIALDESEKRELLTKQHQVVTL